MNIDLFQRAANYSETTLILLVGEGVFHQFHGGTTTNADPDEAQRRVETYREQYRRIRGTDYATPHVPIEFLGTLPPRSMLI